MMSLLCVTVLYAIAYCAHATLYTITSATTNWQSTLTNLKAGDIVTIHHGIYTTGGSGNLQLTLNGQLTQPIIIQGAQNEARPIIQCPQAGVNAQNVINIQGSNFVVKGLAFTKGSRGVRLGPGGEYATVFSMSSHIFVFSV